MSASRQEENNLKIEATASACVALMTAAEAGVSAYIRGTSIIESASMAGIGSGIFALGMFAAKPYLSFLDRQSQTEPSILGLACRVTLGKLMGTFIGFAGAKLFGYEASTEPFIDAAIGAQFTTLLVFILIIDHNNKQNQNTRRSTLSRHSS